MRHRLVIPATFLLLCSYLLPGATTAYAACMNKYVYRVTGGDRMIVTLLTGKLTFQDAQDLSKQIAARKSPPIEWVDNNGKTIATQFGELKVLRPMPVGCDDKPSGVVVGVIFPTRMQPAEKMQIKLSPGTVVTFDEQKQ